MKGKSLKRIMAFDFGLKNIGIAIGQIVSKTANTFDAIEARNGTPSWKKLDALIKEWDPDLLVIGSPLNMDGTKSEMQKKSHSFGMKLKSRYNKDIEFIDERLSTKEAIQRQQDNEFDVKLSSKITIHGLSAKIILESWFREKNLDE
jgi:putative Holliday junction resolvase